MRAALRALSNLVRVALFPLWFLARRLRRPRGSWIELSLSPRVVEIVEPLPLWRRLVQRRRGEAPTSVEQVVALARELARDATDRGLLVHIPPLRCGWSAALAMHNALRTLADDGKRVVAYLPQGGGHLELLVALGAGEVFLSPRATLAIWGMAAQPIYVRGLLSRLGLEVEVQACGRYKTAAEQALLSEMSEPQREQLQALLNARHACFTQALGGAGQSDEVVAQVLELGYVGAQRAIALGLVQGAVYGDALRRRLDADKTVPAGAYLAHRRARVWRPIRQARHIAVVPVHGTITLDSPVRFSRAAAAGPLVSVLRELREDKHAAAVVLHVDSPGGSALASDLIHHEVVRLQEVKPVVAYFGDVAASGGYYVSAACDRIVAQPTTVTGSIGVITAKLVAQGLLEQLGLTVQTVRTAPHADMFSFARAMSDSEREVLERESWAMYDAFVGVVAAGRKRAVEEIEALAGGRVWSGRDAQAHGLVDVLGGFEQALGEARGLVKDLAATDRDALRPRLRAASGRPPPPAPLPEDWTEPAARLLPELSLVECLLRGPERVLYHAAPAALPS